LSSGIAVIMMAVDSAAGASNWLRDLLFELHLESFASKFVDELLITKYVLRLLSHYPDI